MKPHFLQPYRQSPSTDPSLSIPNLEVQHATDSSVAKGSYKNRRRPAGYTATAPWLQKTNNVQLECVNATLPNPYDPPYNNKGHSSSWNAHNAKTNFVASVYLENGDIDGQTTEDIAAGKEHADRSGFNLKETGMQSDNVQNSSWNQQAQQHDTIPNAHGHTVDREPKRQKSMRLLVGNRNAKRMPRAADGTREWSTDLCLFCDHNMSTCCKALWCPCIIYGRNKARIEHLDVHEKAHPLRGGSCSGDCALHACLTMCLLGWAIQIPNRASVRRRYQIDGDWLGDCAAAFCCSSCELSQESRELDLEEQSFGYSTS